MLRTYEALLQPDGQLQFLEPPTVQTRTPRRVLVTFTDDAAEHASVSGAAPNPGQADWTALVGALKASPNWQGDPQAVQEAMRRDWD